MQLTKTSDSMISWYGPGFAEVSGRSHFYNQVSETIVLGDDMTNDDVFQTGFGTQINCTSAATTKCTDNEHLW